MTFMFWLFFAMLTPVWIPVIATVGGGIADAVQRRRGTHAPTGAAAIVAQLQTKAGTAAISDAVAA
ncbi:hypothetical protein Back2_11390 [Nocardioides baekrokdamisoli]|uniref:Uncharacterized protein n=1 Tax=Nocardioides baekrokdamisoli TaxID=1804624 RepID=A0A3G9IEY2_9ACTN|nr:hypothetical protein [Nocardioides baekrokdamisoli]BBH16852.1 hypothetical protein Back2_11390 [Nocardioides baekrokdamisoli]